MIPLRLSTGIGDHVILAVSYLIGVVLVMTGASSGTGGKKRYNKQM
jgi:hypothetical protein